VKPGPLLLDTGGWLLALAGVPDFADALAGSARAIVPGLVLAEIDWHLRSRRRDMHLLLNDLRAGAYVYEPPTTADLSRAVEIDRKFLRTGLGLVDASVAALAERLGVHRILTTDSDFVAVRIGSRWDRALELAAPLPVRPGREK